MLIAIVLAAGCGNSRATAPSPMTPAPAMTLAAGSYRLMVTMATTGDPVCTGPFCTSISLCSSINGPVAVFAPTTATLQRDGNTVLIRAEDAAATFHMNLQLADGMLSGTASGKYVTGGIEVFVDGGSPGTDAVVSGTVGRASVTGKLTGSIQIGGSGCSNNGHSWTLTPL